MASFADHLHILTCSPDAFELSGLKDFISIKEYRLLGDKGYSHVQLVTPDAHLPAAFRLEQKQLCSVVERVAAFSKCWEVANGRFRQNPEVQSQVLYVVYSLVAMILRDHPLSEGEQ